MMRQTLADRAVEVRLSEAYKHKCCTNCLTKLSDEHRRKSGEFSECGACKKAQVVHPALYCGEECAKEHWQAEHRALHERKKMTVKSIEANSANSADHDETLRLQREKCVQMDDEYGQLVTRAQQANDRGDFRKSVKLARKAVSLDPACTCPIAHYTIGCAYADSGDWTNAAPFFLKAMEVSDTGTLWHSVDGDRSWATAVSAVFDCFNKRICTAVRPAWLDGDLQVLKRMANRAVAADPDYFASLSMRAAVYGIDPDASADDLRQALRDYRRLVEIDALPAHPEFYQQLVRQTEARLRKRIASDIAAERARSEAA